jgi:quercetin dioxygenase-like cupin family protein
MWVTVRDSSRRAYVARHAHSLRCRASIVMDGTVVWGQADSPRDVTRVVAGEILKNNKIIK